MSHYEIVVPKPQRRCKSCGGIYCPTQEGGYYHVCPRGISVPRNENIDDTKPKPYPIKAEGKGSEPHVEVPAPLPPVGPPP